MIVLREMNFIKNKDCTLAVRPENLAVTEDGGDMLGTVSTVMLMGHYVLITAKVEDNIVKCYVSREIGDTLKEGSVVRLKLGKYTQFPLSA